MEQKGRKAIWNRKRRRSPIRFPSASKQINTQNEIGSTISEVKVQTVNIDEQVFGEACSCKFLEGGKYYDIIMENSCSYPDTLTISTYKSEVFRCSTEKCSGNVHDQEAGEYRKKIMYLEKKNNLLEKNVASLREEIDFLGNENQQNQKTHLVAKNSFLSSLKKSRKSLENEKAKLHMRLEEQKKIIEREKREKVAFENKFQETKAIYENEKVKNAALQKLLEDERTEKNSELRKLRDKIAELQSENISHIKIEQTIRGLFDKTPKTLSLPCKKEYFETETIAVKQENKQN